jgi:hypothetical protein
VIFLKASLGVSGGSAALSVLTVSHWDSTVMQKTLSSVCLTFTTVVMPQTPGVIRILAMGI